MPWVLIIVSYLAGANDVPAQMQTQSQAFASEELCVAARLLVEGQLKTKLLTTKASCVMVADK